MEKHPRREHGGFIKRKSGAQRKVQRFRGKFPDNKVEGLLISGKLVRKLLDHGDCTNLKCYFALDDDDELTLILAPADREGRRIGMVLDVDGNLRGAEEGMKDGRDDDVLNNSTRIPPPPADL